MQSSQRAVRHDRVENNEYKEDYKDQHTFPQLSAHKADYTVLIINSMAGSTLHCTVDIIHTFHFSFRYDVAPAPTVAIRGNNG